MAKYRIAWLPGDGVGNDVMEAARIVLDSLNLNLEFVHGDIGWEFWCNEGDPLPARTIAVLKQTDCALFGAITSKPKEEADKELIPALRGKGFAYSSPIVRLRQEFDLHTNLRPCKAYAGNPLNYRDDIDIVVFRENTEDLYSGIEFHPVPDSLRKTLATEHPKMKRFAGVDSADMALTLRIITRPASQRIIRSAFAYAKEKGYKNVTVVEKPNVLRETSGLFIREARKIAQEYPGIELWETNIDAMCMWLIKNPQNYGVLVTSNLFGDIISDLCAQLVGGLGFSASGNLGGRYAVFEPTHGSAPKYAGLYKVNPIAMILTVKLMLEHLGEEEAAARVENAVKAVLQEGLVHTYDMGGTASTLDMAKAISAKL